jgi:hypothetical protein
VTENRVLRRIFGVMRKKVTESLRMWHREELHSMYSLSTITGIIEWTIGGAEHVVWMVQLRNAYTTFVTKFCREGLGINGRIICTWILRIEGGRVQTGFNCLSVGSSV